LNARYLKIKPTHLRLLIFTLLISFATGCTSVQTHNEADWPPAFLHDGVSSLLLPGGEELFFAWESDGVSQIWKMPYPQGPAIQITFEKKAVHLLDVTTDKKYLIVRKEHGLYLLATQGGALLPIVENDSVRIRYAFLSSDADSIFYFAKGLYRYTIHDKKTELIFFRPGSWFFADALAEQTFLLGRSKSAAANEFYRFDIETKSLQPVLGQSENQNYQVTFGAKPDEYFVLTSQAMGPLRLYSYRAGVFTPLSAERNGAVLSFETEHIHAHLYLECKSSTVPELFFLE
jgi:hypothetical protein